MKPVALAGLVGLALVACSAPAVDAGGSPSAAPADLRLAVVGDSLSAGFSRGFTQEGLHPSSYVYWVAQDPIALVGGTAVPGATSVEQQARTVPVAADVLVLALGTNDLFQRVPFEDTAQALREIASIVDAPRVMVLAVPPAQPEFAVTTPEFNRALRRLATAQGWEFSDAVAVVRDGDGWAPGMTTDGVHYTDDAARLVGEAVRAALLAEG